MSESRQTHVTLHDIDPQALEQLVQYAYTAEIVVGEGNVQVGAPPDPSIAQSLTSGALLSLCSGLSAVAASNSGHLLSCSCCEWECSLKHYCSGHFLALCGVMGVFFGP